MPATLPRVHPTAIIDEQAEIAETAEVGPYCVLTGPVRLESGVRLLASCHIQGPATIGEGTVVYPGAALGFEPQDYKFAPGSQTAGVVIGRECIIREHATVHAASNNDTPTTVGDACFLMACTHVGHDCQLGNNVILVNYAGLSGHTAVGDRVTLSGHCGTHQHVRIGRLAFFSAGTHVSLDVPPFCVVNERNRLGHVNLVGMRRSGMNREEVKAVHRAFRKVLRNASTTSETLAYLAEEGLQWPAVQEMHDFIAQTKRGIVPGLGRGTRGSGRGSANTSDDDLT